MAAQLRQQQWQRDLSKWSGGKIAAGAAAALLTAAVAARLMHRQWQLDQPVALPSRPGQRNRGIGIGSAIAATAVAGRSRQGQ